MQFLLTDQESGSSESKLSAIADVQQNFGQSHNMEEKCGASENEAHVQKDVELPHTTNEQGGTSENKTLDILDLHKGVELPQVINEQGGASVNDSHETIEYDFHEEISQESVEKTDLCHECVEEKSTNHVCKYDDNCLPIKKSKINIPQADDVEPHNANCHDSDNTNTCIVLSGSPEYDPEYDNVDDGENKNGEVEKPRSVSAERKVDEHEKGPENEARKPKKSKLHIKVFGVKQRKKIP